MHQKCYPEEKDMLERSKITSKGCDNGKMVFNDESQTIFMQIITQESNQGTLGGY